ncbi:MAG: hypothetical protein ACLQVW_26365, partial [Limisphaerales bacterium]
LKQAGPNAPALQKTIVETNLKKFDTALAQIRATEPDCAAKRERIKNERLAYEWKVDRHA